jgi:CheY-like chemotaxis protein
MLDVLSRALSGLGEIRFAGSVNDAVSVLRSWDADLIISEYRLSNGTGLDLLDQLRRLEAPPPVLVIASRADAVDRLNAHVLRFEEIVQKPFFAWDVRERVKRALGRASLKRAGAAPGAAPFQGSLEDLSVVDLLQALDLGRKTCAVMLTRHGRTTSGSEVSESATIFLVDGQVRDAQLGKERGESAVYKLLGWKHGEFAIDFSRRPESNSISGSTQGLLLEGLRMLDEAGRN